MDVVEIASNMLMLQSETEGIIQKSNNPRTRLKYGVEVPEQKRLFDSSEPIEFGEREIYIYPTDNRNVFITLFTEGKEDSLPVAVQNSAGESLDFLSELEQYLTTRNAEEFRQALSIEKYSYPDIQKSVQEKFFRRNPDFEVNRHGLNIKNSVFLFWTGEAVVLDNSTSTTKLIMEFEPFIDYMHPPEIKNRGKYTKLTECDLYIIQRATNLYDSLIQIEKDQRNGFDTKVVELLNCDIV